MTIYYDDCNGSLQVVPSSAGASEAAQSPHRDYTELAFVGLAMGSTGNADVVTPSSAELSSYHRVHRWLAEDRPILSTTDGASSHDSGFIVTLYNTCYELFQTICRVSCDARLAECLGTFYLWSQGLDFATLESCVQSGQRIRDQVLLLLCRVAKSLTKLTSESPLSDWPCPESWHRSRDTLLIVLEKSRLVVPGFDEQESGTNSEEDDDTNDTDAVEADDTDSIKEESKDERSDARAGSHFARSLQGHVMCLMDLLPSLQHVLANQPQFHEHDQNSSLRFVRSTDAARSYIALVRDKFPSISRYLAELFGEANWQRFIRIRKQLAQVEISKQEEKELNDGKTEANDEFETSVFIPATKFHDSGLGTSIPAQSRSAGSVASHGSFLSTQTESNGGTFRVPPTPPEVFTGHQFTCFICGQVLEGLKNRVHWKMHVFADLQPYICTFEECKQQLLTYPSRALWAKHEFLEHCIHIIYKCPLCDKLLEDRTSFAQHMTDGHRATLSGLELVSALSSASKAVETPLDGISCPFCAKSGFEERHAFVAHVSRHMEEIALATLPTEDNSDEESEASQAMDAEIISQAAETAPKFPENIGGSSTTHTANFGKMSQVLDQRSIYRSSLLEEYWTRPHEPAFDVIYHKPAKLQKPKRRDLDVKTDERGTETGLASPVEPTVSTIDGSEAYAWKLNLGGELSSLKKPENTINLKALPTRREHTSDQLNPEGDEYLPREYDDAGEKKVNALGYPQHGRQYRCRTFTVPGRGEKLFMLATECARVLTYRDSYLLFKGNRPLYKIIATQKEKEDLITQEVLPFSYRSRQIAIVTARSMFRQFGSRIIVDGRRVRDDYWESKARKQGFTEDDPAGEKRPGASRAREAAGEAAAVAGSLLSAFQASEKLLKSRDAQAGPSGSWHEI